MSTPEFLDKAGHLVHPGDLIVYGHALGRCAGLRYGKVLAVQHSKTPGYRYNRKGEHVEYTPVRLRVQGVDDDWAGDDAPPPELAKPGTLSFESRVLKIRADQVPPTVAKLLAKVEVPT